MLPRLTTISCGRQPSRAGRFDRREVAGDQARIDGRQAVVGHAAGIVADDAEAGKGVDAIIGVEPAREQRPERPARVGRVVHLPRRAGPRGRRIAIADAVGIADELDLPRAPRQFERLGAGLGPKAEEAAAAGLALGQLLEPDDMLARCQPVHGKRRPVRPIEHGPFAAVDEQTEDLGVALDGDGDAGAAEPALEIDSGPAEGERAVGRLDDPAADMDRQTVLRRERRRPGRRTSRPRRQRGIERVMPAFGRGLEERRWLPFGGDYGN